MKISHEVPICLLEQSKQFNDYDYILPHLLDKYPEYEAYMRQAKKEGRYLIMDNSLHELGTPYNEDRLLYWLGELEPNEFIIPDIWENAQNSFEKAVYWKDHILYYPKTTFVTVIQSRNFADAGSLYKAYKNLGYEKIAFSYGADYYAKIMPHYHSPTARALGRLKVIIDLCNQEVIDIKDRIHLLGCNLPQEFLWYKAISQIESIDTSNPIMAAIGGIKYEDYGLLFKPKTKIDEVIDKTFDRDTIELINYNINKFKLINGLYTK